MRLSRLIFAIVVLCASTSQMLAATMSFDDIPEGTEFGYYYGSLYGIHWDFGFHVADHTGSAWGPPHSGSNVLAWNPPGGWSNLYGMGFKKPTPEGPAQVLYAQSVGGYFSTEPGVVLQMVGYHSLTNHPDVSVQIGAPGESWNNVYVGINYAAGVSIVGFGPVTTDALEHFCADDITVNWVPEPSTLTLLSLALTGVGVGRLRRRR